MKRASAIVLALATAIALVAQWDRVGLGVRYVHARLTPKATVDDRLKALETNVVQRLAPALQVKGFSYPLKKFALLAIKDASLLQLYGYDPSGKAVHIKDYAVLAKSGTPGPKLREGDRQIPEGIYKINFLNPNSLYHLSLRLNYPNDFDEAMARKDGRTQLGGDIMIHGRNVSIGCIAIGDPGIEEVFCLAARAGLQNIKVIIVPSDWRVNPLNPRAAANPPWLPDLYAKLQDELARLPRR
jgi:murein L,D-transpeptidase YafK